MKQWRKNLFFWFDEEGNPIRGCINDCFNNGKYFVVANEEEAKRVFIFCYYNLNYRIAREYLNILVDMTIKKGHIYIMEGHKVHDLSETTNEVDDKINRITDFIEMELHSCEKE